MKQMFYNTLAAKPDTRGWDTSNVINMESMFFFSNAAPNTSRWNTSKVTNMKDTFRNTRRTNPDTSGWNTSSVTNMEGMFAYTNRANPDTSRWNTASVTNMKEMFFYASQANPDTSQWDTSKVTNMENLFHGALQAAPNISLWNTSNVTNMIGVFYGAGQANPDTSRWKFTNVNYVLNSDIENRYNSLKSLFLLSGLSVDHYSKFLISLDASTPRDSRIQKEINVHRLQYNSSAVLARQSLITKGWTILDGGLDSQVLSFNVPWLTIDTPPFAIVSSNAKDYAISGTCNGSLGVVRVVVGEPNVEKDLPCSSNNTFSGIFDVRNVSSHPVIVRASQKGGSAVENSSIANKMDHFITKWHFSANYRFTLPIKKGSGLKYNFTVNWGDGSPVSRITSFDDLDKVHTYADAGEYKVTIKGVCEGFQNDNNLSWVSSGRNLYEVMNLGDMGWKDLSYAFRDNDNLTKFFGGNTSHVTDMKYMFYNAERVVPDTRGWDTSNVTDMGHMFIYATSASPGTSGWNFTNLTSSNSIAKMFGNRPAISGLSIESYSKFLIRLNNKAPTSTNVQKKIDVGSLQYQSSAGLARKSLVTKGWTIIDGGLNSQLPSLGVPWLKIDMPLAVITSENARAYTIRGTCNSNPRGVRVFIKPNIAKYLPCRGDNTFVGVFDLKDLFSNPVMIEVSQEGGHTVRSTSVANTIEHFITKWNFPKNYRFVLPLKPDAGLNYNFIVDWGDGGTSEITSFSDSDKVHTYAKAGEYTVTIKGVCEGFQNNEVHRLSSKGYLREVVKLGDMGWKDLSYAFQGNNNLGRVSGGNTSGVTHMENMFYGASKAMPDTSGWETANVTSMRNMFFGASQANPDTRHWDFKKITQLGDMFGNLSHNSGLSIENYSRFLIRLNEKIPKKSIHHKRIHVGVKFHSAAFSARNSLIAKGWVITDGGLSTDPWPGLDAPWLKMDELAPIGFLNIGAYTVSGTCNSNPEIVKVVVGEPNIQKDVFCGVENTFSVTFDLQSISSNPTNIQVSQSEGRTVKSASISNEGREYFITKWSFPSNYKFILPLKSDTGLNYNFIVEWGDGNTSKVTSFDDVDKTHTYTDAGEYTITMKGLSEGFQNNSSPSNNYLLEVSNLGSMQWKDLSRAFENNDKLETFLNKGNTSGVTNMSHMFYDSNKVTPDISGWDTSKVKNMEGMFAYTPQANPETSDWNTSSVTNMKSMFKNAFRANPDTSDWDTSSVTNMESMFAYTRQANPDTSDWNTSSVTNMKSMFENAFRANPNTSGWDTSKVTNMGGMFFYASQANSDTSQWNTSNVTNMLNMFHKARQANPNTSGWDTSKVTNMIGLFYGASQANPDTGGWDFTNVTYVPDSNIDNRYNSLKSLFLLSGLSVDHYSKFLISLDRKPPRNPNIQKEINVNRLQYNSSAVSARARLVSKGWTIVDGGVLGRIEYLGRPLLTMDTPHSPLVFANAGAYTISGLCNEDFGAVRVVVGEPNVEKDLPCLADNTFSGNFDVRNISSHPIRVRIRQRRGPVLDNLSIANKMKRFITKWTFPANYRFTLPLKSHSGLNYDFKVDWGDGSSVSRVTSFNDTDKVHTYAEARQYTITITGLCEGFHNNNRVLGVNSGPYLNEVVNLGDMGWKDLSRAFYENRNLTKVSGGNTSNVTSMENMFYGATQATVDTRGWDVSKVVSMNYMFVYAPQTDPDTRDWDFTNVTWHSIERMFSYLSGKSGLSIENYSRFLIRLNEKTPTSVSAQKKVNVGSLKYSSSAVSARASLIAKGWTITDGGLNSRLPSLDISWLKVNEPLTITLANAGTYPIHGTCHSNSGPVKVVVGEPNVEKNLPCRRDNTFSGALDLENVSSHPAKIHLSQKGGFIVDNASVANGINRFVTKWKIPAGHRLVLPLKKKTGIDYDFTVDWGDGSVASRVTSFGDADKKHVYSEAGDYIITITGRCEGLQSNIHSSLYLREVINLGDMGWENLSYAFSKNVFLTKVLGGNTSRVKNMSYMFYASRKAVPDTSGWDTSNVKSMEAMFKGSWKAKPDTRAWNTSNVTNMSYMFYEAYEATPATYRWNTFSVKDMSYMFAHATQANPYTVWNTYSLTNISRMFYNATKAKPNTERWNTSRVTKMKEVFKGASQANPDVSAWEFRNAINLTSIFSSSGLSTDNYSKFLIRFNQGSPISTKIKKIIDVGSLQYNSSATLARKNLVNQGWSITDGGLK